MILWVKAEQAEALAAFANLRTPAMVSPPRDALVSVIAPSLNEIGNLFADRPRAVVTTRSGTGQTSELVLATQRPGHSWSYLTWTETAEQTTDCAAAPSDQMAASIDNLLELCANSPDVPDPATVELTLCGLSGWQGDLIDHLCEVLPLPETRELVDKRVCIGPEGPSLRYAGMLTGPVEAAHYAELIWIAHSLAADESTASLLGPIWSKAIDRRFDIIEAVATGAFRGVKLLNNSVPTAFASWNSRWAVTPQAPAAIHEQFANELARACPWPWDRNRLLEVLHTPDHADPLGALAEITQVPNADPYMNNTDWSTLDDQLIRIAPASGAKLAAAKISQTLGMLVPVGAWRRIRLSGRGPYWPSTPGVNERRIGETLILPEDAPRQPHW